MSDIVFKVALFKKIIMTDIASRKEVNMNVILKKP